MGESSLRKFAKALMYGIFCLAGVIATGIFWPEANAPLPSRANDHVITNVHVIDVVSGKTSPLQSVKIIDGVIAAISKNILSPNDRVIDGQGGYLIPGLWDMHSHSFQLSPQLHFPLQLANGVTGVRDMMGCPESTDTLVACDVDKRRWNKAADQGNMASPRFIGSASFLFDDPNMPPVEAASRAILYARRGADYLKIYDRLTRATYARIAQVSRQTGKPMVGHLPKAVSIEEAISAGQSSFEHARLFLQQCYSDDKSWRKGKFDKIVASTLLHNMVEQHDTADCDRLFALMAEKKVWFVPTHVTREEDARASDPIFLNDERLAYADPLSLWAWRDDASATAKKYPRQADQQALQAYFLKGLELTGKAHAAGVPILVGTDTIIGGFKMHDEMALLIRAGLTPAQVLRAATYDAALYAGKSGSFGSIAVGKRADLVLLRKNPLDDIKNTKSISHVFLSGHLYYRNQLNQLLTFTKTQANHPANWIKLLWGFAFSSVSL